MTTLAPGVTAWPFLPLLLLSTVIAAGHAQHVDPPPAPAPAQQQETLDQGSAARSIGGGIFLGVGGFLTGGLTASHIARDCASHEWCQLEAAFYGAAAGGTLGMALGAHLANRRRGNLALDFLTGAAVWGTGIGIAAASDWNETVTWVAFVTVPIAQLASTVAVERAVGRSRSNGRRLSMSLAPHIDGGATLAASLPF